MMISTKFILLLFLFICCSVHLSVGDFDYNFKSYFDKKYCPCPVADLIRRKRGTGVEGALGGLKDLPKWEMKFLVEIYAVTDHYDKVSGADIRDNVLFLNLKCTGTIINPRFVLTAKFCTEKLQGNDEKLSIKTKGMVIGGHGRGNWRYCDDNYVKFIEKFHDLSHPDQDERYVDPKRIALSIFELEGEGFEFGELYDIYPACFSRYMADSRPQQKLRFHVGFGKRTPHPSKTYEVGRFKKSIKTRGIATTTEYDIVLLGDWDPKGKIFPAETNDHIKECAEYRRLHQRHSQFPFHCTYNPLASTCHGDIGGPLVQWWESKYYVVVGVNFDQINMDDRSNIVCNNSTINLNIPINFQYRRHSNVDPKQIILDRLYNITNSFMCLTKNYHKKNQRPEERKREADDSDESSFDKIWITFILIGFIFALAILLTFTILKKEKMLKNNKSTKI